VASITASLAFVPLAITAERLRPLRCEWWQTACVDAGWLLGDRFEIKFGGQGKRPAFRSNVVLDPPFFARFRPHRGANANRDFCVRFRPGKLSGIGFFEAYTKIRYRHRNATT
jgi:hypothetical protein